MTRGGGTGRQQLGKPCPPELEELMFCERTGFAVMPSGLLVGVGLDEQPADRYLFWARVMNIETRVRNDIRAGQEMRQRVEASRRR